MTGIRKTAFGKTRRAARFLMLMIQTLMPSIHPDNDRRGRKGSIMSFVLKINDFDFLRK